MTADILVLGVGFTGLLVAETLARHRDRSEFTFAIAGRSQHKLDQLVDRPLLRGLGSYCVDVSNYNELKSLIAKFRVVINCTSPYWKLGIPVVTACVSTGAHYLDLTGELPFYLKSVSMFDATGKGKTAPSVVIHACGYESIPSDIVVFESVQKLRQKYGLDIKVSASTTAMDLRKAFVSRGTAMSGITMLRDVPRDLFWKSLQPFSLSPRLVASSKLIYELKPYSNLVGSFFLLSANNIAAVNRTWSLLQCAGSPAAYGEDFMYNEFLVTSSSAAAGVVSMVSLLVAALLIYVPPENPMAGRMAFGQRVHESNLQVHIQLMHGFDLRSSHSVCRDLKTGSICATNITKTVPSTHDPTSHCAKTVFKTIGGDGGYMGSAVTVAESALLLVLYDHSALPFNSYPASRVLTPAAAFGSMLTKRLVDSGFYEITTEILH